MDSETPNKRHKSHDPQRLACPFLKCGFEAAMHDVLRHMPHRHGFPLPVKGGKGFHVGDYHKQCARVYAWWAKDQKGLCESLGTAIFGSQNNLLDPIARSDAIGFGEGESHTGTGLESRAQG